MVVRALGVEPLARLMAEADPAPVRDWSWLLAGPTDPAVVDVGYDDDLPLAAE